MKKFHSAIIFPLLMCAFLAVAIPSFAARQDMPNVLVWVYAANPDGSLVSITYPNVMKRDRAERDLKKLLAETGWRAGNINITDDSVMASGEHPMTSVEFSAGPTMDPTGRTLPIEPIVKAFRNSKQIAIVYVVPQNFVYEGPGDFENKYVKIALARGSDTYSYDITIKDSDFKDLGLPKPGVKAEGRRFGMVHIFVLAVAVAVAAYFLTRRITLRGRGPRSRSGV
ncbi:MAG: hypothetical protein ACYC2Y_05380 [Armatimonadota bacterium]